MMMGHIFRLGLITLGLAGLTVSTPALASGRAVSWGPSSLGLCAAAAKNSAPALAAVCTDPAIKSADGTLVAAMGGMMARAAPEVRTVLRQSQERWRALAIVLCVAPRMDPEDGEGAPAVNALWSMPTSEDTRACLAGKVRERAKAVPSLLLEVGDVQIAAVEWFELSPRWEEYPGAPEDLLVADCATNSRGRGLALKADARPLLVARSGEGAELEARKVQDFGLVSGVDDTSGDMWRRGLLTGRPASESDVERSFALGFASPVLVQLDMATLVVRQQNDCSKAVASESFDVHSFDPRTLQEVRFADLLSTEGADRAALLDLVQTAGGGDIMAYQRCLQVAPEGVIARMNAAFLGNKVQLFFGDDTSNLCSARAITVDFSRLAPVLRKDVVSALAAGVSYR